MVCLAAPVKKVEPKVAEKPKRRVKKDKDAPKKPMPPFFCYQKHRRNLIKAEHPTWENTLLIKVSLDSLSAQGTTDELCGALVALTLFCVRSSSRNKVSFFGRLCNLCV